VASASLPPALRRTTTCSIDLSDRSRHGPKSLPRAAHQRIPAETGLLGYRRRTGPVVSAPPSWSRFRPLVPGSSRVFRARCSCAREPCGRHGRPSATAPGTHEPPWVHAPEPPLLLFSSHRPRPGGERSTPVTRRTVLPRHCHARSILGPLTDYGVQKSVTVPSPSGRPGRTEDIRMARWRGRSRAFSGQVHTIAGYLAPPVRSASVPCHAIGRKRQISGGWGQSSQRPGPFHGCEYA
jgi:hypothetical protein